MVKALAGAFVAVLLAAGPAAAGALVTGAVADRDGFAVAGARVVALDADGTAVGAGRTAADGTFALDAGEAARPVAVDVRCTYCEARRETLGADGTAVVIVNRRAALRDRTPSGDDIAALPYGRAAQLAALVPYAVAGATTLSDRGLDGGRGVVLADGLRWYRSADGANLLDLIPLHATSEIRAQSTPLAPVYGARADAGTFDVRSLGPPSGVVLAGGDGFAAAGRIRAPFANVVVAGADDGDGRAARAAADATAPFAGGTIGLTAAVAGDAADRAQGANLHYATRSRRYATTVSLEANRSAGTAGPYRVAGDGFDANASVRGTGTGAVEIGARVRRSGGRYDPLPDSGTQDEAAIYADARIGDDRHALTTAVALQRDAFATAGGVAAQRVSLVPSVALDVQLDPRWAVHAGLTSGVRDAYLLQLRTAPGVAPPAPLLRSTLVEAAVAYSDLARIRVDGVAYAQRADDGSRIGGFGLNAAWQIAPRLALRSWLLDARTTGATYAAAGSEFAAPVRRHLAWLTYDGPVRVDVLLRAAGIDGSVGVPLGHAASLMLGTYADERGRVGTFALRLH